MQLADARAGRFLEQSGTKLETDLVSCLAVIRVLHFFILNIIECLNEDHLEYYR